MDPALLQSLRAIAGLDRVRTAKEDLVCYSYDAMNAPSLPGAVVYPDTSAEVSGILRLANEQGIPVYPRGAGSSLTGGAAPLRGGIVLSFEKMNRILKIDAENLTAVVEPGVITARLHAEAAARGLMYPPDPASMAFSTLGGNVATCAGGLRAVKYGVTKNYVLGLEIVLASGEIMSTGVETVKRVVGYDLTKLITGSEGTLAVITRLILKLLPRPEARKTLLASYPVMEDAARTVSRIFSAGILPAAIEFMDRTCIGCVAEYTGAALPRDAEALLLIEDDGPPEVVERHGTAIADICRSSGAGSVVVAADDTEAETLWASRRAISPSLGRLGPKKINEDVAVPRQRLPELVRSVRDIAGRHRVTNANFGHAGDGNLHINILFNPGDPEESARAHAAVEEILARVVTLGGTISGEHGIGLAKKAYIGMEIGEGGIALMRKIKAAFDPRGILNPGKLLP